MSDTKWADGPWSAQKYGLDGEGGWEVRSGGNEVCTIAVDDEICKDEEQPTAHLIAAAPELYDALEYVAGFAATGGKTYGDHPAVKAALAKARGES